MCVCAQGEQVMKDGVHMDICSVWVREKKNMTTENKWNNAKSSANIEYLFAIRNAWQFLALFYHFCTTCHIFVTVLNVLKPTLYSQSPERLNTMISVAMCLCVCFSLIFSIAVFVSTIHLFAAHRNRRWRRSRRQLGGGGFPGNTQKYWQNTECKGDLYGNWLVASWFFSIFSFHFVFVQFDGFAGVEPNEQTFLFDIRVQENMSFGLARSILLWFRPKAYNNVLIRTHTHT